MIKKYSLKALEKTINYALSLDENLILKLAPLDSKVIKIIIDPLKVDFFIRFQSAELQLLDEYTEEPDTIISSNPLGFIRLSFLPASKARSLFNDKIQISGDIQAGADLKHLFDELDLDWEGHLALFTGDVIAYQIGSLFKHGLEFQRKFTATMGQNLSDFMHEELRIFPPKEELEDFFHDIYQLSSDVDRLEAKISLCSNNL